MKPIIFSNEDRTQTVTFTPEKVGEEYDFTVDFFPSLGEQDEKSVHFIMASTFMQALKSNM